MYNRDVLEESIVSICEFFIYGLFLFGLINGLSAAFPVIPHFGYITCVCGCGVFSMICSEIAKIFKRDLAIPSIRFIDGDEEN